MPDFSSIRAPDTSTLFRPMSVTNVKERVLPPVGPQDMVDANGYCAGVGVATSMDRTDGQPMSPDPAVPVIPSAIGLEMTECEVVRRAGPPERVEIGSNDRNERTATLTYSQGPQPGIYRFTVGRLKSMERAPEPPPQARPARTARGNTKAKISSNR